MDKNRPEPSTLVIFGATGDLARRKLLPALYRLQVLEMIPESFNIIGFSTRGLSDDEYREYAGNAIKEFYRYNPPADHTELKQFTERISFVSSSFEDVRGYQQLSKKLSAIDREAGRAYGKLFYFATPPSFFSGIIEKLHREGMTGKRDNEPYYPRIIIEKPFGRDEKSAKELNSLILNYIDEEQIYRIDHYLGKETVQNILFFRFANGIYEPIWNRRYIDHIQITVAESIGVENRGKYFEEAGILKDMVQNHILQLLALFAMEPPINMDADVIRGKKIELLHSIRHIEPHEVKNNIVRGQYGRGKVMGQDIPMYREEKNVSPSSYTETFAALKLFIDNWRWADVPFYIRTGKRLKRHLTEIAIHFKNVPHSLFSKVMICCSDSNIPDSNILVFKIQPDEGINFQFNVKRPGSTNQMERVNMDFSYKDSFKTDLPDAYERLINDFMIGDSTLFPHSRGIEASWSFITDIIKGWEKEAPPAFPDYEPGTWGPKGSDELIARDGRVWRDP
ncbi:MAG: glucose-6-phosphate dehydrogenase [Nitrospirota bacterium]